MNKDNTLIVYKMAWAKCALMAVGGGITAWTTAMDGVAWSTLNGTEQMKVIMGCIAAMILVTVAFLDRTIQTIQGEREEIPGTPESVAAGKSLPSDRDGGNSP